MKPGVSQQQAQAELETLAQRLPLDGGQDRNSMAAKIIPLKEFVVGNVRESLVVFAGDRNRLVNTLTGIAGGILLYDLFLAESVEGFLIS